MPDAAEYKRYYLRDVARLAGVSVATVSRVLNAPSRVAPETRTRVQVAMSELRFMPSAAARAINSGRTRMVAALLPTLDNSIYARVVDGLESGVASYGLSLMVAQTAGDPETEYTRARQLIDIGAEGLVVVGLTHSPALLSIVEHLRMPILAVSCFDRTSPIPTIGYDNAQAAEQAAYHLLDLGHQRIAVVHGPLENNDRFKARRYALERLSAPSEFTFFETDLTLEGGCKATQRVLATHGGVTAILCFSDVIAMGVMSEIRRQGGRVPEDVSVLGMEDLPSSAALFPALTSVRLQVRKMGELAADALSDWVENGVEPQPVLLASTLIARASTTPVKAVPPT